jgi:hypothetical protein
MLNVSLGIVEAFRVIASETASTMPCSNNSDDAVREKLVTTQSTALEGFEYMLKHLLRAVIRAPDRLVPDDRLRYRRYSINGAHAADGSTSACYSAQS